MKGFLAAIGAAVACVIVFGKIMAGLPDPPPENNIAKFGDHFAVMLNVNRLTCDRIVSISPAGYTDCADGHQYRIWAEPTTVREGAVERDKNVWHVRVIGP
jgi:hypothetical protein